MFPVNPRNFSSP